MAVAPQPLPLQILDLRMLRAEVLRALFEEEQQAWREELHWDYRHSVELLRRHIDAHNLPGYTAVVQGEAVGFCFFVYEDHKGLLGDLYVRAAWREQAIATRLLEHALETLEQSPIVRRIEAQLIPFGLEPLEPIFAARQYDVFPRLFMFRPLEPADSIALAAPAQGLRRWDERDFDFMAELIVRAYRGHMDSQINDHYGTEAGAQRFLQNIIVFPGCGVFQPGWSVVAPEPDGLAGAVLASEVAPGVAHITQVCVRPERQGRGLGRALLLSCLQRAAAGGCRGVSLTVTTANRNAVALYERLGFQVIKEFNAFTRTLR
ncbi:MAG TPA: GNAT family N-acetyltransferase [Candidatus Xenobia bacterium]|nr:GNAT family N-acetyltransferase [Candidatus Xenobia bacterium]